jgi:hypothetical protein
MDIAINVANVAGTIKGTLDIGEADLNMIFQLSDVTEPQKRKANYVRKFTIPGTKNNNQLFNGIFEQGYSVHLLNPNKKLNAQVLFNGNIVFEGALQLNKIIKNNDNQKIGYEITIYGSLADFFNDIKDAKLSDIDFSEYNHNMIRENIMASWASKVPYYIKNEGPQPPPVFTGAGYTAKSMNGFIIKNGVKQPFVLGEGYVYPFINKGQTSMNLGTSTLDWTPAVYVKTIMRKIFDKYGWKWRSNFFESETFKRLIIPYGKEKITDDFFASLGKTETTQVLSQFIANVGVPAEPGIQLGDNMVPTIAFKRNNNLIKFTNDTIEPGKDDGGLYDPATGFFTPLKTFTYGLYANVRLSVQMLPPSGTITYVGKNIPARVKLCDVTNWNPSGTPTVSNKTTLTLGSGTITELASTSVTFPVNKKTFISGGTSTMTAFVNLESQLTAGRKYAVLVDWEIPAGDFASAFVNTIGQYIGGSIKLFVSGGIPPSQTDSSRFYATVTQNSVEYNQTVNMNKILDSSIAIKDFIVSINNLFNLYWKPTNNDREFIIEPRDTFFNNTNVKDWTDKIDNAENVTIEPLYELTANKYSFAYMEDSDYLNDDYQSIHSTTHGSKKIEVDNDFIDNEEVISPKFAASPQYQFAGTEIVAPAFIKKDATKYTVVGVKSRILFYGGLIPTKRKSVSTLINFAQAAGNKYVVFDQDRPSLYFDNYPYCGHNDHPFNPNQTLEYGMSKKLYYDLQGLNGAITNNNLFNVYWRKQFLEQTDPDSHLLSATCVLTSLDIQTLDLTGIIEVNFVKYRINKITYNPITYIAEVELIKKLDTAPFTPSYMTYGAAVGWSPNPGSNTGVQTGGVTPWKPWREEWNVVNGGTTWEDKPSVWGTPWMVPQPNFGPKDWGTAVFRTRNMSQIQNLEFSPEPVVPNNISSKMRQNSFADFPPTPSFTLFDSSTTNVFYRQQNQIVQGENNRIAAGVMEVAVRGSNNTVASNARKIAITGDNNTVQAGVENVTIVGDNQIVSESNVSIIQGVRMSGGRVVNDKVPLISGNSCLTSSGVISGGINNVLIGSSVIQPSNES